MKAERARELVGRWADVRLFDLKSALARRDSPFGVTTDGLADFRGAEISIVVSGSSYTGVDLSFGRLSSTGQLGGKVKFVRCLFQSFECDRTISGSFERCDFGEANLNAAVLLGDFRSCLFESARLTGVRASQVAFTGCSFEAAVLNKSSFLHCRFRNCNLNGARWRSGSASGSTFEDCTFDGAEFRNLVMTRTVGFPVA